MPSLESLQRRKQALIRKAQGGALFVAPDDAPAITALTELVGDVPELVTLPEGYTDLGYISKEDSVTWSRATETADTTSWGASEPTRTDFTSDVSSLAVTAQETNLQTLSLYEGLDLSTIVPTAGTGEVAFSKPTRPGTQFNRLLAVAADGVGDETIYIGKFLPRAQVTEIGDQAWSDTGEIVYPLTFTARTDDTLGYSIRYYFGGPGWLAMLTDMGFPAAAAGA